MEPVRLADRIVVGVTPGLRHGILLADQRRPAIDPEWPSVQLKAILLACHGRKARLAGLDSGAVFRRHWWRAARTQLERVPCDRYIVRLLEPRQTNRYKKTKWADKV